MSFSKKAAKILTNKYFLYFVVFLAATTVFGYLVLNQLRALIVFALVGIISYQFSKNMAVVLLICILATNLLMSSKIVREGLENSADSMVKAATGKKMPSIVSSNDTPITPPYMGNENTENISNNEQENTNMDNDLLENTNTNTESDVSPMTSMAPGKNSKNGSKNRIDYASTLEEAYDNLDKILGSDGIKNLTTDTHKLMEKQQQLFKAMESMAPMLESAQNMLQGFDMKSLQGLTGLASKFTGNEQQ
jgi:hypothetical protein